MFLLLLHLFGFALLSLALDAFVWSQSSLVVFDWGIRRLDWFGLGDRNYLRFEKGIQIRMGRD